MSEGLILALHAQRQLPWQIGPVICASEVVSERTGEILPAIDTVLGQTVQPGPSRALQHERCIADCYAPIASCNLDCCQVIGQPVFGLHSTIVLWGISRQREAFGKLLRSN